MDTKQLAQMLQGQVQPKPSSGNQRAYADMLEELACMLAQSEYPAEYKKARSVRSPEDFTLTDGVLTNYIDVKTRQLGTDFNMPNLISVDRLDKLLATANTELYYWMIDYRVEDNGDCTVVHSEIRTVWSLPWSALAIQNLGKGQLQIAKWAEMGNYATDKTAWHAELTEQRKKFYRKQIAKLQRILDTIK
jgi:hypothetical protein